MPRVEALENLQFGGVDSRSNPLNLPSNRSLRCNNWVPREAGNLELRWGYATVAASTFSVAFHSIIPFTLWDGAPFLILGQGTNFTTYNLSSGTQAIPSGTALTSSSRWGYYQSNNKIYVGNGADQVFFDGSVIRPNGLAALTQAQIDAASTIGVTVTEGVRELSSAEASTVTFTIQTSGGTWGSTTGTGYRFYIALFDPTYNEVGPATVSIGSGPVTIVGPTGRVDLNNLLSAPNGWIKLLARTEDGGTVARFCTDTSSAITSCTQGTGGSVSVLTVRSTSHGMSTGDVAILFGTTLFDSVAQVTVVDADTLTILATKSSTAGQVTTGGTIQRIKSVASATTSTTIASPQEDTISGYIVNSSTDGLAASAVGGTQPGYQFYVSVYNAFTLHASNRIAIGERFNNTERCNVHINNLGNIVLPSAECSLLIGRTGDGALIPYEVIDANSAPVIFAGTVSGLPQVISGGAIDGSAELPTRNGVIHPEVTMFALITDRVYAADPNSPTIRRSGSLLDATTGNFVGDPAQSWADDDIETFPTAAPTVGIHEVDSECFVATKSDSAILSDQSGVLTWRGPWNIGLAGPRAKTTTSYGFYWLSHDKQLCSLVNGLPTVISEEYEAALLADIGDSFLDSTSLVYFRSAALHKDELRIECLDSDGNPFTVIHDFKLRDGESAYGQGYGSSFVGPLASAYTPAQARDANGKLQSFAGAASGTLYLMYSGANDAGHEYDADLIGLANLGTARPDVPFMDWHGDGNLVVSYANTLKSGLADFQVITSLTNPGATPQGAEEDFLYRAEPITNLFSHVYLRLQLTSHSADGNLGLNDPPHVPLENYGRVWDMIPAVGQERGR